MVLVNQIGRWCSTKSGGGINPCSRFLYKVEWLTPYKCIRCPGLNLPGFSRADLSIGMGLACPGFPLGFLAGAGSVSGRHTMVMGIGWLSGAKCKKPCVVRQKASTARFDATHHGLPDAQWPMGLLLFAQWCRTNRMILARIRAGVNTLRLWAGCRYFLQSALQLTQGP